MRFHIAAEQELNEAADFYDLECPGLGESFLLETERVLDHLRAFPQAAPRVLSDVRCAVLARFPFTVMFSLHGDELFVLALAHHKRRPFYWRNRS